MSENYQVLEIHGVPFAYANVLESDDLRQDVKDYSDWPTIPQVYIDGCVCFVVPVCANS